MRDFDWKIIVTLNKTRNITKTANMLFLSQPTLTKRIQAIEEELGISLLLRNRRGSEFTPEGELIAKKAEAVIAAIQEAKDCVAESNSSLEETLHIGVPYSYVRYVMPALLAQYTRRYPKAHIDIVTALSDELARSVESGILDLCFARYSAEDSYLQRMLISEDQLCAVYNRHFALEELAHIPYIQFNTNQMTTNAICRWWNEHYDTELVPRFKVSTGDCCVSMVQHGMGFGIFTDSNYFSHDPELYSLPLANADGSRLTRKTWLMYKQASLKRCAIADFVDFISTTDMSGIISGRE